MPKIYSIFQRLRKIALYFLFELRENERKQVFIVYRERGRLADKTLYYHWCYIWSTMVRIERGMVSIIMISLFNKELIGVYLDRELGDLWRVCISALMSPFCDLGNIEDSWLLRFSLSSIVKSSKFVSRVNSSKSFIWGSENVRQKLVPV